MALGNIGLYYFKKSLPYIQLKRLNVLILLLICYQQ
jgi:hypothetical protein